MTEKGYAEYAWVILMVMGLLELQFGLTLALRGPSAIDNANLEVQGVTWQRIAASSSEADLIDYVARSWGVAEVFLAITIVAIAAVPFRRGERWSWCFLWLFPALAVVSVIRNLVAGVTSVVLTDSFGAIVFAAALLLSCRKLIPKVYLIASSLTGGLNDITCACAPGSTGTHAMKAGAILLRSLGRVGPRARCGAASSKLLGCSFEVLGEISRC